MNILVRHIELKKQIKEKELNASKDDIYPFFNLTDMSNMFMSCRCLTNIDLEHIFR